MNKIYFVFSILIFCHYYLGISQVEIDLDKALQNKGELLINEIASDIDFVKLETTDNCYFYSPSDILIVNSKIFFYDRKLSQFFMFNYDGKFIKKFGQRGKGPNEYLNVQNFAYDKTSSQLFIFTREKKIFKYTLNGDLAGSITINANPLSMLPLNGRYIGFYPSPVCLENKNFYLSFFNMEGIFQKSFFTNIPCQERDAVLFNRFYQFNDAIRFWDCGNDTVYSINSNFHVNSAYTFSSKRMMPYQMYGSLNLYQTGVNNYITVQNFMESDRFIFIKGRAHSFGTGMFVVYDKSNNKSVVLQDDDFNKIGLKDNLISSLYFWPLQILHDGRMVCCVEIADLKAIIHEPGVKMKFLMQDKFEQLKIVVSNSKIDDNPILFLIKLKNMPQ
jgi:hypothetical protein